MSDFRLTGLRNYPGNYSWPSDIKALMRGQGDKGMTDSYSYHEKTKDP